MKLTTTAPTFGVNAMVGQASTESFEPVPKLKTVIIILCAIAIPGITHLTSKHLISHPFGHRAIWVAAFFINLLTLNIPGRFDGMRTEGKIGPPWRTLFEPASWAFAIWGMIYLGEALLSAYAGLVGEPLQVFRKAAPFWLAGNLFQSLWCMTFRPQFKAIMWLPATFLLSGSVSLLLAHNVFTTYLAGLLNQNDRWLIFAARAPIALHAAWLAAATLLNINGWAAVAKVSDSTQIAVAFSSVFAAFTVGLGATLYSKDPLLAATVAWALAALAYRSHEKTLDPTVSQSTRDINAALSKVGLVVSRLLQLLVLGVATAQQVTNIF